MSRSTSGWTLNLRALTTEARAQPAAHRFPRKESRLACLNLLDAARDLCAPRFGDPRFVSHIETVKERARDIRPRLGWKPQRLTQDVLRPWTHATILSTFDASNSQSQRPSIVP